MFINGEDQTMATAADKVDSFLAAHGVLDIAWEPFDESEPQWWILMPRPPGLPGHLFALIDTLQWRHPSVQYAESRFSKNKNCRWNDYDCVPGCPNTAGNESGSQKTCLNACI